MVPAAMPGRQILWCDASCPAGRGRLARRLPQQELSHAPFRVEGSSAARRAIGALPRAGHGAGAGARWTLNSTSQAAAPAALTPQQPRTPGVPGCAHPFHTPR
ncbi:MAG: hypothetical protein VKK03_05150 [Synechococcus sp.]|nr:hypothetical protein [Synechococcus sp.]